MKRTTFLFALVLAIQTLSAQNYIVTLKGDTLRGEVKILSYDRLDRVELKQEGKKKVVYTALEARALSSKNEIYHSVQQEGVGIKYMKLIKPGFLNLYAFRLPNQFTFDGQYLLKKTGMSMEVPNLTFKKSLSAFLSDCEDVSAKVKNGDYSKKDMDQIISEYNTCIGKKNATVPVEKVDNPKVQNIDALMRSIEAKENFNTKKDALDILKDIRSKATSGEAIPGYLIEGLKSNLAGQADLNETLEKLITSLKN